MRHKDTSVHEIERRGSDTKEAISIDERLKNNPTLRARIESIIAIAENEDGSIEKADDAEQRALEELRKLGNELLHAWAERQQQRKSEEQRCGKLPVRRHGKKKLYWQTSFGQITVREEVYRTSAAIVRPFSESAAVRCRGYSTVLQRIITDFGAEVSFHRIGQKLKEHYGLQLPQSTAQAIVEEHAKHMYEGQPVRTEVPEAAGKAVLIGQMDGSMVPIVETATGAGDRRKGRQVKWQEARLCMVREPGRVAGRFGATMGGAEEAGKRLLTAALLEGMGSSTRMHCVGDGAVWIAEQVEKCFGAQGTYLIDFYHLCEYLSGAAAVLSPGDTKGWMERQRGRLKENRLEAVMQELRGTEGQDSPSLPDTAAGECCRYMRNRPGQFDYKGALEAALPIGSGEIESGHRHVIQQRLKLSGAWWKEVTAEHMLALRVTRANNEWDRYWQKAA